jgi:hypothetical protein
MRAKASAPVFVLAAAGGVFAFCVYLVALGVWKGPAGFDVYYYALQTASLVRGGELLFSDSSAVYGALYLLNRVIRNPLVSAAVLSALSLALIYSCFLIIAFRKGASLYTVSLAGIAVFNPAVFYLLLEFTKNSFAFSLFFLGYTLLSGPRPDGGTGGIKFQPRRPLFWVKSAAGLACLCVSVLSHRVMLVLCLLFLLHGGALVLWRGFRGKKAGRKALIAAALLAGAAFLVSAILLRSGILERLSYFSFSAPRHRLVQFSGARLFPGEHIFYIFMQVAVFFAVPFTVLRKKQFDKPEFVFALAAWLFLFPFLRFSWNEIGFRLLILAPLMAAPWLMDLSPRSFSRIAGVILALGSLLFTAEAALRLRSKGPDYAGYARDFAALETLAKGRRVIAHRGLAGFLWYEKGIRSENFIPPGERERYVRLVYAFSPVLLEPYLREGDPYPVVINETYTLVEEYIWQRFYEERRDLYFLKSELNPYLPRPVSGFVINPGMAALMSPLSEP